jgi:diguanylate cyclase (GGDEF)-like protein
MHVASRAAIPNDTAYSRAAVALVLDPLGNVKQAIFGPGETEPLGIPAGEFGDAIAMASVCRRCGLGDLAAGIDAVTGGECVAATVRYTVEQRVWETTVTALGDDLGTLVCGFDITDLDQALGDLERRARVDPLTSVANRGAALERIAVDMRNGLPHAVMLVDLDHLKFVNDSLGHDAGDRVLTQVAARLASLVEKDGLVARLGGDEFIVIKEFANASQARQLGAKICDAVSAPVDIKGTQVTAAASVGIALSAESHRTPEDLLCDADAALYQAKAAGRGQVALFTALEREQLVRASQIETELRDAIASGSLTIAMQPIVDVRSRAVVGAEALIRWPLSNGQLRAPFEFLDIAAENGLIGDIDLFVLDEACAALRRFKAEMQTPPSFVCFNVSVPLLARDDFVEVVTRTVASHGLTPDALCIEVPETILARDHRSLREKLAEIRNLGAFVALDDFGTGWSSLGALRTLPVDVLKIDKSFVDGLGIESNDTAIVTSILSLAKAMGLHVVAEGVESWPQVAELARLGCPVMQGFRLSRPVAVERFASTAEWVLGSIPDRRNLARKGAVRDRELWRGQATFIDEFLHQLNVPRRAV